MGIFRRGFLVSCAAVLIASNPKKAKNTIAAPRRTPDQPYSPNTPVFCGINGVKFSAFTYLNPMKMNSNTTAILSITKKSLNFELPLVPHISISDRTTISNVAGTLKMPPSAGQALHAVGSDTPISFSIMQKYLLHDMLTVMAASAYSNTKSQPITQATNSPMVK